ncbi:MFS transporter [Emcibacter nanhaiensis]|uniref:MFS transporter n=1 Tax=Emcibacter nanhaiensis TaxID=1505037 RepID=A0A501PCY8_9PROT|nr:MFS transporter [Emcibacter nanhaiensis]TPD57867.1 MFS transporter [Emcibacter nanhaiensis]
MKDNVTPQLGGRTAWYILALVGLCQAMSMVDRQILAILMPRIKEDLHIGDAEMGLLYGTVFALFYAVFSLPLGRLADGWVRTKLLGLSIFGWSIMTALGGMANGFGLLAISRLGVGVGEASVQPAGMSLVSDVFPKRQRGTVTAIIAASIALGLGGALTVGGAVADAWDAAWPDGNAPLGLRDWQAAFLVASLPGLILGYLMYRTKEPRRGLADGIDHHDEPHPFRESWLTLTSILPGLVWATMSRLKAGARDWAVNIGGLAAIILAATGMITWTNGLREENPVALSIGSLNLGGNELQWMVIGFGSYVILCWMQSLKLRDKPSFELIVKTPSMIMVIVIVALQTIINYGVMAWTATHLITAFGQKPTEVGLVFGPMIAAIGIIGPLIAGPVSDWANSRFAGGRLYVTFASLALSLPLAIITFMSKSVEMFYFSFACYGLILTMWLPPFYATLMDLVLPRMRGTVMSYYILTMTIFGLGLGPYVIGLMSDINGGDLAGAILNLYWISPFLILLTFVLIRRLPKDEATLLDRARAAGEKV